MLANALNGVHPRRVSELGQQDRFINAVSESLLRITRVLRPASDLVAPMDPMPIRLIGSPKLVSIKVAEPSTAVGNIDDKELCVSRSHNGTHSRPSPSAPRRWRRRQVMISRLPEPTVFAAGDHCCCCHRSGRRVRAFHIAPVSEVLTGQDLIPCPRHDGEASV
jgi:hypothetical protein